VLVVVAVAALPAAAQADTPRVKATCVGVSTCNGWFTTDVHLRWDIEGGQPVAGCKEIWITTDPGPAGLFQDCTAEDPSSPAHDTGYAKITIFRDTVPPSVTDVVAERPPDHDGWYTHPVSFTPKGSDATSGVLACNSATYVGPDSADARIVATCTDKAGLSASRAFPLRYDATPPDPGSANLKTGDKVVRLSWPAGTTATVMRTPGTEGSSSAVLYQGPGSGFTDKKVRNGRKYRYVLTLTDPAGNSASRELSAEPDRHLVGPAKRATVSGHPRLTWTPVRGARYYNVQLFRNGTKILSRWPRQASLQLKPKWRFHGRRYRLKPGEYRWYVWPGKGPRAENRYGRMVGKRSFTVASS